MTCWIMRKIPPDNMVDVVGQDRVNENKAMIYWIDQYNLFMKAKNLGVKFSPNDLTAEQVEIFTAIRESIEENDKVNKK